jgi:SAM-dependent methyltransferase
VATALLNIQEIIKKSSNPRLNPSRFNNRYFHLKKLRDELISIMDEFLSKEALVLVDFGCGKMPYRPLFENYVKQYVGVDLPENKQADVHIKNGQADLPNQFADIVISTQVLEHVSDPQSYLKECYRLLKPDGLLILSTHGYWMYHPDPTDFWRWTCDGLKKILEENRFKIVQWRGVMGLVSSGIQLFQDGLCPKLPGFLRGIFGCILQFFIGLFDQCHTGDDRKREACVFIAVCSKV